MLSTFAAAGAAAVFAGLSHPKFAAALATFAILFSRFFEAILPQLGLLDEAAVIFLLVVVIARRLRFLVRGPTRYPGALLFALFFLCGALSSILRDVPLFVTSSDGFLAVKAILFGWAIAQIDWRLSDWTKLRRFFALVCALILVFTALNLVLVESWYQEFSISQEISGRAGILSLIGPFGHVGFYAQLTATVAIVLTSYILVFGASPRLIFFSMLFASLSISGLRRKAVVGLLAGLMVVGVALRERRTRTVLVGATAVCVGGILLAPVIGEIYSYTVDSYFRAGVQAPRVVMYTGAFALAGQYFPLGAGLGRYGTATAQTFYSPEYDRLGFRFIYGLDPDGVYATDTFWPAVLGQSGVLGLLLYAGGLAVGFRYAWQLRRSGCREVRMLAVATGGVMVQFLIESIAAPTYLAPPASVVPFGLLGLLASLSATECGRRVKNGDARVGGRRVSA